MLTDSTSKTNIPMVRKPFSGILPPGVPVVAADDVGGAKTVGGVTSVRAIFVNGRVIQPIPDTVNLGGYNAGNEFRGLYIKNGEIIESENLEHIEVTPLGSFTVPVAKVKLSGGEEFTINVPAQKIDTNSIKTTPGSGRMPLMTPVWLDYIAAQDSGCIPVLNASGTHIEYSGRYTFSSSYAVGGDIVSKDFMGATDTFDSTVFSKSSSGGTVTYTSKKKFRCLVQTTSGRNFGNTVEMSAKVNDLGTMYAHQCPVNQTYAFTNSQVYELNVGSSIIVSGSTSGGWASIKVRALPPVADDVYTPDGSGKYNKVTSFASDGSLPAGATYYCPNGTTVSGSTVAFPEVYEHLAADYNAGSDSSDTYTCSDGTTVTIYYRLAADKHKICAKTQLANLNKIYDDESIGEAFYYVLDGGIHTFQLPRTKHGFHGERGYAKVSDSIARMYLHFIAG